MMRWAVLFEDTPGMARVRASLESAHLRYLEQHQDRIRLAGGLKPSADAAFCGGLWIVEAATRDAVVALIENDPYYCAEPRPYRIHVWGQPFPGRKVTL